MSTYKIQLIEKIEQYRLDRYPYWEQIKFMAERNMLSEQSCKALLYQLEPFIQLQKDFPNYLHRSPTAEQLYAHGKPSVRLGTLLEDESLVFGVRFDLPLFMIIAGTTGFGKTTAARVLQKGVFEFNRLHPDRAVSVITFDRKVNDYADLARLFGWLIFSVPGSLIISLEAPDGVPPNVWINVIATIFCARAGLKAAWVTFANTMRWLLAVLNPVPTEQLLWPDFQLLLDVLNAAPETLFSSKFEYTRALKQALEGITQSSGSLFRAFRGFQAERDILATHKSAILSMPNVFPSWTRQLFTDIVFAQVLYGRIHKSHRVDSVEELFVVEEADADISSEAEEMFPDRMCPISQCFKQGRELGISVCVSVSSLWSASRFILSNATNHFIFRMTDAESILEASRTLMLPPHGELSLNALQPGECLIRQVGPWPHAMLGKIDYMPPCRTQPDHYDTHFYVPSKRLADLPEVQRALSEKIGEHKRLMARQSMPTKNSSRLGKVARSLLDYASLHPYEPLHRLIERMDNPSPATQQAVIKELKLKELAIFETVRLSHSSVRLMEITEKGWHFLGKQPPKQGRGGIMHCHFVHWIIAARKKRGCKATSEWLVPGTQHAVDVAVEKNGEVAGYEVVTYTKSNIISHIKACFVDSNSIQALIIITAQKTICEQMRELVQADLMASSFSNRIEYQTIDTFLKEAY